MKLNNIINYLENKNIKVNNINYNFNVGDNISVYYSSSNNSSNIKKKDDRLKKRNKVKNQILTGYVISKKGDNKFNKTFIIRKIINNIGVEITFYLYSPYIKDIKINKRGKVKKAKLYYLRKLSNKKIKLKNKK
ncbi:MAG: 50S ribosomal protein L19 [Candidatus Shikimatogenerans bostrichidophilus]|nr:MAG: 50S ribosomal protein L19 [Candidatus Shikimatogenerans bostrichidophilus]